MRDKNHGFTLVELMVGMLLLSIILYGLTKIYVQTLSFQNAEKVRLKLYMEALELIDVIANGVIDSNNKKYRAGIRGCDRIKTENYRDVWKLCNNKFHFVNEKYSLSNPTFVSRNTLIFQNSSGSLNYYSSNGGLIADKGYVEEMNIESGNLSITNYNGTKQIKTVAVNFTLNDPDYDIRTDSNNLKEEFWSLFTFNLGKRVGVQ